MSALADNSPHIATSPRGTTARKGATDEFYANSFVGIDAAGYAAPWADTSGYKWLGFCTARVTGNTSATPIPTVPINDSGLMLRSVDVANVTAITDVGATKVYCSTDNPADLSTSATTNVKAIGILWEFRSTSDMDVRLFTPTEYEAQALISDITALTDSSGGSADNTIASVAAATTLTDNTGGSGSHDDTLADGLTVTDPDGLTGTALGDLTATQNTGWGASTEAGFDSISTKFDALIADVASIHAKLLLAIDDITVQNQNDSDLAQKVMEIVTWQAAVQNNIADLTTKLNEVIADLNLA